MSNEFGHQVVEAARGWVGTPFHWAQSAKGVGCDCKGLIRGVAAELGRAEADSLAGSIENYRRADPRQLKAGLASLFDPAAEAAPGDILLLRVKDKAQHLAIYAGAGRMIHTYTLGPQRVIEVPMGRIWWAQVDSIWRWRDDD